LGAHYLSPALSLGGGSALLIERRGTLFAGIRFRGRYWGGKADMPFALHLSACDPRRTWVRSLSFGAGLMVLETPHKVITDTAYQASVAESSVALPPE